MGNHLSCGTARCSVDCSRVQLPHELPDAPGDLGYDPAGAVFDETLHNLNEMDRQVLRFAGSTNLAAMRWLLFIGARKDVCDSNGTTPLHAACRSGSLQIVKDLVRRGLSLHAVDICGWTALHVAIFMGRRNVTLYLLQSGAHLHRRNLQGATPEDLCNDPWTKEAIKSFVVHSKIHSKEAWRPPRELETPNGQNNETPTTGLQYEPFFVPRDCVHRDAPRRRELQKLGIDFFANQPGKGLAFLVAVGAVRDYPVDISAFLLRNRVDSAQLGQYLGEDFSLSQTLRLEFINSIHFGGTGVVSALSKVFLHIQIPEDLHKIDRLCHGMARIWWRQHEHLDSHPRDSLHVNQHEVAGDELRQDILTVDGLHQLMFSTVMLHWNLFVALPEQQKLTLTE